ncbi:MAG: hypothetical protein AAFN38_21815 [Cyanobacteria bacterium J06560_5]
MVASASGPSEQLQSTMRNYLNREVREWFQDVDFDALDIKTSRGALAASCRHDDNDSFLMTIGRAMLFESLIRQRFESALLGGKGDTGETVFRPTVRRRLKPQLKLFFMEDIQDVADGYAPVSGRISIRLMSHDSSSVTPAIARTYATKVKTNFSSGSGFVWRKGKDMCSYTDWDKGYQFQLLCRSESEGRRVVEQVLDIQNDSPDWSKFQHKENAEPATAYPTIPGRERIYGEIRQEPRLRPIADVRFKYASLHIEGLPTPIILVDRTGVLPPALVA